MKSKLLIWIVIALGTFLRVYGADRFPIDNNDDGLFYVWSGSSFIQDFGRVTSHSIFDSNNTSLIWRSQHKDYIPHKRFGMKIVSPWFDHPPFGAVIVSLPALVLGYTDVEQVPHLLVRLPALWASVFTLWLTYILAKLLFDKKTALFSLVFFATVPYFVFAHRQSYLENILTPFFLTSVIGLVLFLKKKKNSFFHLSLVSAFFTGWIKIVGFAVPLMNAAWLSKKGKNREAIYMLAIAGTSVFSYLTYGWAFGGESFLQTIFNQGARGVYFHSLFHTLTSSEFYASFPDGLHLLAWLSTFWLLLKHKKHIFSWYFVGWLVVLFLTSGPENNSPWYKYQLLPFLSIGLGAFVCEIWEKLNFEKFLLFLLLGFTGLGLLNVEVSQAFSRIALVVVLFIPTVWYLQPKIKGVKKLKPVVSLIMKAVIVAVIAVNCIVVLKYPSTRCTNLKHCLLPGKILLTN